MSDPQVTKPTAVPRPKSRKHNEWLIVGGALGCLAIALLVAGRDVIFGTSPSSPPPNVRDISAAKERPDTDSAATSSHRAATNKPADLQPPLIDDDDKTLWVSPTNGKPLDLAYLSPGAQVVLALRPAEFRKHAEGEKVLAALGPAGQHAIELVEHTTTVPLAEMERLVAGCQATGDGNWLATFVVHAVQPITNESLLAKLPGATEKEHGGKKYWLANNRAYFLPGGAANRVLVIAPEDAIHDVIDLAGQTPPLRRDIERLIAHTDADRQLTIVLAPNSLFGEGQSIFSGEMTRLRAPLFWFLGDELSGAALSMNWDANYFLELIVTPTLETSPEKAARIFSDRVAQIPDKLEEYVVNLDAQSYGRLVIARFPEMLRKLAIYTRHSFESDHAVLRCYLPVVAGHNLLLAAELMLAETPGATNSPGAATSTSGSAPPATPAMIKDRLAKVTSLKFARDTLESALEQLAQDIGAPIIIRGPDLQADGITKNQSFGIDVSNKPAEQILVEILRLANPDKTSPGPNDARQNLVYIIEAKADKTEQIVVTTRAKAAERHDELPAAFRTEKR